MVWLPLVTLVAWLCTWLPATVRRTWRPDPSPGAPPLVTEAEQQGDRQGPHASVPGEAPLRALILRALAPRRMAQHRKCAGETLRSRWMCTSSSPGDLEDWMHLDRRTVQQTVEDLLGGWIGRVAPTQECLRDVSAQVLKGSPLHSQCEVQQLLLVSELTAAVHHLVRTGEGLCERLEELAQISFLLARWHMPDHLKTKRLGGAWLQWLATVVPAFWLVALWTMQLRGGERRVRRARRGVRFLHPRVQLALAGGPAAGEDAWSSLQEFLVSQCRLVVRQPGQEACMYVLGSRSDVYVGITGTARKSRQSASSGAACRYWEHLVEIRAPPRPGGPEANRKVACFRSCRPGHVGMLVVALGARPQMAGMEAAAIAAGGCRGNTAGTRGTGLMPRRHKQRSGAARCRPPPGERAGPADVLRAAVHWLAGADARRAKADGRAPRREAARCTEQVRSLPYSEQYPALQRALWHLGRGQGPIDILHTRGDTLLAAWFASVRLPCLESLLQRAGGDKTVVLRACDAVQALPASDGKRRGLDRVWDQGGPLAA